MSFKDRFTELSIEYALMDYELRTNDDDDTNETLENNFKVFFTIK